MAPPHTSRNQREDRNAEIYSLHRYTNWGYDKIVKATGVAKSIVRGIIKRGEERGGDVHDAPRAGCPTKITDMKRRKVESVIDEDPRLPLRDIASRANVGLGHSTVDKIISGSKFRLLVPRKSRFGARVRRTSVRTFVSAVDFGQNQLGGKLCSLMSVLSSTTLVPLARRCASVKVKSWQKKT
jgi:transposase